MEGTLPKFLITFKMFFINPSSAGLKYIQNKKIDDHSPCWCPGTYQDISRHSAIIKVRPVSLATMIFSYFLSWPGAIS